MFLKFYEEIIKTTKICWIVGVGEVQRNFNLIDLVKSFPTSSTQTKVTPELFLSRDGELRDIQEEFSECVRYMLRPFVQIFIFQFLSMSLFLNLLLEPDPYSNEYSNEYLVANFGFDTD